MKKVVALILFFLIIAAVLSHFGFFENPMKTHHLYGNSTDRQNNVRHLKGTTSEDFDEIVLDSGAKNNLNKLQDSGTEIVHKAPLGDGLYVLVICSMGLAAIKFFNRKRQHL